MRITAICSFTDNLVCGTPKSKEDELLKIEFLFYGIVPSCEVLLETVALKA